MRKGKILRLLPGCPTLFCLKTGIEYIIEDGQRALVHDEYCRKTGKRDNDGSMDFMDAGSIADIELIGGPSDGLRVSYHDSGGTLITDEEFFSA